VLQGIPLQLASLGHGRGIADHIRDQFLGSVPKTRTDLLPHYARFAATLNKYMPDIGVGLVAIVSQEFAVVMPGSIIKSWL
jgi:hypothetical protein